MVKRSEFETVCEHTPVRNRRDPKGGKILAIVQLGGQGEFRLASGSICERSRGYRLQHHPGQFLLQKCEPRTSSCVFDVAGRIDVEQMFFVRTLFSQDDYLFLPSPSGGNAEFQ